MMKFTINDASLVHFSFEVKPAIIYRLVHVALIIFASQYVSEMLSSYSVAKLQDPTHPIHSLC